MRRVRCIGKTDVEHDEGKEHLCVGVAKIHLRCCLISKALKRSAVVMEQENGLVSRSRIRLRTEELGRLMKRLGLIY